MNTLGFSNQLIRLRHEKKVTQEQVADFVGVTKASVSKWENRQSFPDITLLPQLASFFNVTIDELLEYKPQLNKEQIQKIYQELARGFALKSFEEAMENCRTLVHQYYSCFPFLLQICTLWLNHFPLAGTREKQISVLKEAQSLCEHILKECNNTDIYSDAVSMNAMLNIQLGKPREVIEALEDSMQMNRTYHSDDSLLIQAYLMTGEKEKAISRTQISMYMRLIGLIGSAIQYLQANIDDLQVCEETIRRIGCLKNVYQLEKLHPNIIAQAEYQSALVYMHHKEHDKAIMRLKNYTEAVLELFQDMTLHGDMYFTYLEEWIEKLELGNMAPRDKKLVAADALQILSHPLFAELENREDFMKLKKQLREGLGNE